MIPQREVDKARTIVERFMIRWRGEPDPRHVEAIDAYWVSAAEHGMNASTFTGRVIASTGADVAACHVRSGGLDVRAAARRRPRAGAADDRGGRGHRRPRRLVREVLDQGERLMGFGHRVYRAEDPRARVLRDLWELGAPRSRRPPTLEQAALAELRARRPGRAIATNVEFWAAVILDFAGVPASMLTPMFTCAAPPGGGRTSWSRSAPAGSSGPPPATSGRGPRMPRDVRGWGRRARRLDAHAD